MKVERRKSIPESIPEDLFQPVAWPADFEPPKTALFMAAAAAVLSVMLFAAAALNALSPVKVKMAMLLDAYNPGTIANGNYDLAAVVWGVGLVILGGIVHPSVGIAILIVLRPWIDGYTFPTDNLYFVAAIFALAALWAVRAFIRGEKIQGMLPGALLAGFVGLATAELATTWQVYATSRGALMWFSYLTLFLLTANSLNSRMSRGVVLAGLCAAMGSEALFSVLHFEYLLPYLRNLVINDPEILRQYFNTDTVTPELARRFNINRAFGSMLFPNGLASYLILGLPIIMAGSITFWRERLQKTDADPVPQRRAAGLALGAWVFATAGLLFTLQFPATYRQTEAPWYLWLGFISLWSTLLAIAPAGWVFWSCRRQGLTQCGRTLALWILPLVAALMLWGLWATYSRGGWLAFLVSLAMGAPFIWAGPKAAKTGGNARLGKVALTLAIVAAGLGAYALSQQPSAWAEPGKTATTTSRPTAKVTQEGLEVGAKDLMDPASFRVRFTYWRVGLAMFWHNPLCGVGLGNFAVAYPQYQYLGAGDVREAHNGYLQMFCETGILGGLLFTGFWWIVLLGSAWRLWNARKAGMTVLWWPLGLWVGLLAFCLHAAIDITLSHPSLVMTAIPVAAMLWVWPGNPARDRRDLDKAATPGGNGRVIAGILLVCMALGAGFATRVYLQELCLGAFQFVNVSDDAVRSRTFRIGRFFVIDEWKYSLDHLKAIREGTAKPKRPQLPIMDAIAIQPDLRQWLDNDFYASVPGTKPQQYRKLPQGTIPDANAFMALSKPRYSYKAAMRGIIGHVAMLERIDARYPYNAELAMHLTNWYELLAKYVGSALYEEERLQWRKQYVAWAQRMVDRNPRSAEMQRTFAEAVSWRALWDPATTDRPAIMEEAISHCREAVRLSPLIAPHQYYLEWMLKEKAKLLRAENKTAEADQCELEANDLDEKAKALQKKRFSLGYAY